ncbi:sulfotransferase 1C2-like isoform X2 [Tachypleus tridentatus]|uniref:sulfotransferase 1C2-like isoform X2 n=1 Tax=Tachypleus tridentatus TaxID=6853 RepID=UPI003FD63137
MSTRKKTGKMAQVRKKPMYQQIFGLPMNISFSPECVRGTVQYKPRDDDIFVVTFPKCGTTWAQHIVHNILSKGKPFESFEDFQRRSPFMEMLGPKTAEDMPRPGAIKTHLPFHLNPYSPKAKYIYVARNPKDCCVSFYHHTKMFPEYQFTDGTFDDFFEVFINGENDWGDYFDHLLSWYEHRHDLNVLFITYEEMKADTRAVILKIASFLGQTYKDLLESDEKLMDKILYQTSSGYMRKHLNEQMENFYSNPVLWRNDSPEGLKYVNEYFKNKKLEMPKEMKFVRKGVVGDWKNYFSASQSKLLREKFKEKTKGTNIASLWPDLFTDINEN